MSCCGKKREAYIGSLNAGEGRGYADIDLSDVPFEYTGETGMTVKGNMTGIVYRFMRKGDQRLVNYRDAGGMMGVPNLRRTGISNR